MKASSHIEVVISFVLFVLFVGFLLLYLRPYERSVLPETVILGVHNSFLKETEINLTRIFLNLINAPQNKNCFYIDLSKFGDFEGNSFLKNSDGNIVNSKFTGGNLYWENNGNKFYIYLSTEFNLKDFICGNSAGLKDNEFQIGSIEQIKVISDKNLKNLKSRYEGNYGELKKEFDIPAVLDFSISSSDEEYTLQKSIPEKVEVVARTYIYNVLYSDGSLVKKEFIFKAW